MSWVEATQREGELPVCAIQEKRTELVNKAEREQDRRYGVGHNQPCPIIVLRACELKLSEKNATERKSLLTISESSAINNLVLFTILVRLFTVIAGDQLCAQIFGGENVKVTCRQRKRI